MLSPVTSFYLLFYSSCSELSPCPDEQSVFWHDGNLSLDFANLIKSATSSLAISRFASQHGWCQAPLRKRQRLDLGREFGIIWIMWIIRIHRFQNSVGLCSDWCWKNQGSNDFNVPCRWISCPSHSALFLIAIFSAVSRYVSSISMELTPSLFLCQIMVQECSCGWFERSLSQPFRVQIASLPRLQKPMKASRTECNWGLAFAAPVAAFGHKPNEQCPRTTA